MKTIDYAVFFVALVFLMLFLTTNVFGFNQAIDSALQATYIQTGVKQDIDNYGKCLEKKYVKKEQEKYWASLVFVVDSIAHSQVRFKLTF